MKETTHNSSKRVPKLRFPEFRDAPEWEEKRLGNLGEFTGGGTPSKANDSYWNGSIPWVSSSDIPEETIYGINISKFITKEALRKTATKLVPQNSILLVSRVGVGKLAISLKPVCTSQDFTNFTPTEVDLVFLAYLLKSHKNTLLSFNQGTSIKGFTKDNIANFEPLFPSLPEQQRIADCLSSLDEWIAAEAKRLDALKDHKKGLMQQLFPAEGETTPPLRVSAAPRESIAEQEELTRRRGDAERSMKETTHNIPKRIPKLRFPEFQNAPEWEAKRLASACIKVTQGGTPSTSIDEYWNGSINWITPAEMGKTLSPYISKSVRQITPEGLKKCSSELLPKHSVIISTRAPIGLWAINTQETALNQGCKGLIPKKTNSYKYLYYVLFQNNWRLNDLGAGNTFKELTANSLKQFEIPIPSLPEQQRIADCLSSLDELITAQSAKIDALKEHKKGLMQQLFPSASPRLRVNQNHGKSMNNLNRDEVST